MKLRFGLDLGGGWKGVGWFYTSGHRPIADLSFVKRGCSDDEIFQTEVW